MMLEAIHPMIDEESIWKAPDSALFDTKKRALLINPESVTVYSSDGRVISRYKDDKWDIKYYGSYGALNFKLIQSEADREIAKRIMYSLLIFGNGKKGSFIAGGTLKEMYYAVLALSHTCIEKNIPIQKSFCNDDMMNEYIESLTGSEASKMSKLFFFMHNTGEYIGIPYEQNERQKSILRYKIQKQKQITKQKAVIPVNIFVNALNQRWKHIEKVEKVLPTLVRFIEQYQRNLSYGRSHNATGVIRSESVPFKIAMHEYGLSDFFEEYHISCIQHLAGYITSLQGTSRHVIYALSGMRDDEGMLLTKGCFKKPTKTKPALITGYEKKTAGKIRPQEWVTALEIEKVILLNEKLSEAMTHSLILDSQDIPLFVSPTVISLAKYRSLDVVYTAEICKGKSNPQKELPLKENDLILTKEMKKEFLEVIDPFRDWDNDKWIKVGKPWRFTYHQYRRTFAVYALNSGLVSLAALQKQFAHLMMTVSAYYGKGSYNFKYPILANSENHPKAVMEKEKEKLDGLVFLRNVLLNKNAILGPNGPWMKKHLKCEINDPEAFIRSNSKTVEKDIKKGIIFCKSTALGRCYSIEPCDSHVTLDFTKCEECSSAELDLARINISIKEQEYITKIVMERSPDTPESQTEEMQLEWLKKLKKKLEG